MCVVLLSWRALKHTLHLAVDSKKAKHSNPLFFFLYWINACTADWWRRFLTLSPPFLTPFFFPPTSPSPPSVLQTLASFTRCPLFTSFKFILMTASTRSRATFPSLSSSLCFSVILPLLLSPSHYVACCCLFSHVHLLWSREHKQNVNGWIQEMCPSDDFPPCTISCFQVMPSHNFKLVLLQPSAPHYASYCYITVLITG